MLSQAEIDRILKRSGFMPDKAMTELAQSWALEKSISPGLIGLIYGYMKLKYASGESLFDIERATGVYSGRITKVLSALEEQGYLAVYRGTKPFQYRIIK